MYTFQPYQYFLRRIYTPDIFEKVLWYLFICMIFFDILKDKQQMHGPVSNPYTGKENHKWRRSTFLSENAAKTSCCQWCNSVCLEPLKETLKRSHLPEYHCVSWDVKHRDVPMFAAIAGRPYKLTAVAFRGWEVVLPEHRHSSTLPTGAWLPLLACWSFSSRTEYSVCQYPPTSFRTSSSAPGIN